jgi:hypothetical protein
MNLGCFRVKRRVREWFRDCFRELVTGVGGTSQCNQISTLEADSSRDPVGR